MHSPVIIIMTLHLMEWLNLVSSCCKMKHIFKQIHVYYYRHIYPLIFLCSLCYRDTVQSTFGQRHSCFGLGSFHRIWNEGHGWCNFCRVNNRRVLNHSQDQLKNLCIWTLCEWGHFFYLKFNVLEYGVNGNCVMVQIIRHDLCGKEKDIVLNPYIYTDMWKLYILFHAVIALSNSVVIFDLVCFKLSYLSWKKLPTSMWLVFLNQEKKI